jgi:hypothetical protein
MQTHTQTIALSQQAYGTSASRDLKSDRAFATTLGAMLLAVLALPFAGGTQPVAVDSVAAPVQQVLEQSVQGTSAQPATATLDTVVIIGRRGVQQAQSTASTAASRS